MAKKEARRTERLAMKTLSLAVPAYVARVRPRRTNLLVDNLDPAVLVLRIAILDGAELVI